MLKKYRTLRRRYVEPTYVQLCTRRLEPGIKLDELTTVEGDSRACNVAPCATHKERSRPPMSSGVPIWTMRPSRMAMVRRQ